MNSNWAILGFWNWLIVTFAIAPLEANGDEAGVFCIGALQHQAVEHAGDAGRPPHDPDQQIEQVACRIENGSPPISGRA